MNTFHAIEFPWQANLLAKLPSDLSPAEAITSAWIEGKLSIPASTKRARGVRESSGDEELLELKKILEPELHWKDRKWIIPTDFKIGFSLGAWKKDFPIGMKGCAWGEDENELIKNLLQILEKLK